MGQLQDFRRKTTDDVQRIWDSVNELHETTNMTARHMEDIYDKDVLKLQDFRASAEKKLNKLREDLVSLGEREASTSSSTSLTEDDDKGDSVSLSKRLSTIETSPQPLPPPHATPAPPSLS